MFQLNTFTSLTIALIYIHDSIALQVTSPDAHSVWNLEESNTITWTAVSTDPSACNIVLVNNVASCAPTGMSQVITQNVMTAHGKYQIASMPAVKECGGYQINLVSTNNNGILAQSAPFSLTRSGYNTQPAFDATGSTHLVANITQLRDSTFNKSQSSGDATSPSLSYPSSNSQSIPSKGALANVTASHSSASTIDLSIQTMLASLIFLALIFII